MLAVQGSSLEEGQLSLGMEYLAKYVRSAVKDKDLAVIGPADETISRISDRYRKVFYLKHPKESF